VEEVVVEVMKANKVAELFQTMAIMSLNMGNLTLEVKNLKNRLATWEKEKAMLHEELDKEKEFQKRCTHHVEIWRENRTNNEHKNKMFIKKL